MKDVILKVELFRIPQITISSPKFWEFFFLQIFDLRKKFIIPNYEACWILVENPAGIDSQAERNQMHQLVGICSKYIKYFNL